ncbi:Hsp70 family protein [Arthrobacter sp. H41]|uniref:Hsp70 family protein n=1 Tax=Arthrobacter sp. H41 TaxID=1312978 RepID=UPI0004B88FF0|nr:Hsp70 family protein [Arthrobacter sp. H41]
MPYGLSVDVGTSFTAAAIARFGGGQSPAPQVLPLGTHANAVPSVIFLGEDGQTVVGEAAERRGLAHPERLVREFKRRMGDDVPIIIGDISVLPEDLFAAIVRWVVDRAEEREGEPPLAVTLTHPAEWGGHKTGLLSSALAGVGLADVALLTEPLAAALHYASQERVEPGSTLAVYDFGGGTFDATVLRKTDADTFTVLGTPAGIERLGGADFDQDVFGHVVAGASEAFAGLDSADPDALSAVARLRRECAEAKEALSTDPEASIAVLLPGAHAQVRLVRSEFEAMIEGRVHETIDLLDRAVTSAGVTAEDLDAVLLIGGSSRIPLVAQLISERLGRPVAIDADPKASIALGAAFATAALQEDGTASAGPASGSDGNAVAVASHAPAANSLTPRHGPHHVTAGRRIRTRAFAVTAAVALLGVATATAANSPTSFTALSDILTGPEQAAEAAVVPSTGAEVGQQAPRGGDGGGGAAADDGAAGGGAAGFGQETESVPRASWFDTVVQPGNAAKGSNAAGGTGGTGKVAAQPPGQSGLDGPKRDIVVADSGRKDSSQFPGAGKSAKPNPDPQAPAVVRTQPADSSEQSPQPKPPGISPSRSDSAVGPSAPEPDPAGTPSVAATAPAETPSPTATAPAAGVLPPGTATTGTPSPMATDPAATPSPSVIPPTETPSASPKATAPADSFPSAIPSGDLPPSEPVISGTSDPEPDPSPTGELPEVEDELPEVEDE